MLAVKTNQYNVNAKKNLTANDYNQLNNLNRAKWDSVIEYYRIFFLIMKMHVVKNMVTTFVLEKFMVYSIPAAGLWYGLVQK